MVLEVQVVRQAEVTQLVRQAEIAQVVPFLHECSVLCLLL